MKEEKTMLFHSPALTVWVIGVIITIIVCVYCLEKWYK